MLSKFLTLITKPQKEPVTFEDTLNHLRLDDMEKLVGSLIRAAREHVDGRDGWLGRALITQTWELSLDDFPRGKSFGHPRRGSFYDWFGYGQQGILYDYFVDGFNIRIPLPPLQEVVSIVYTDQDGTDQTLDPTTYKVLKDEPAQIIPAYGLSWPSIRSYPAAVRVRFTCGYGDNPDDVPMPIRQALLLLITHYYENRDPYVIGANVSPVPNAIESLLYPYRVSWLG